MRKTASLIVLLSLLYCEAMFSSIAFSQQQGDCKDSDEFKALLKLSQETKVAPLYCEPPSQTRPSSSTDNIQHYTVTRGDCLPKYTVKIGDYLSKIAENCGFPAVAYRAIMYYHNLQAQIPGSRLVPIRNDNFIMPGWTLYIPSANEVGIYMNQGSRYYEPTRQNINRLNRPFDLNVAIDIAGSATVYPITVRAAECYRQSGFMGIVKINSRGTKDGIEKLCSKQTQIAGVSDEPDPDEVRAAGCNDDDNKLIKFEIAADAVGIYVNNNNNFFKDNPDISLNLVDDLPPLFKDLTSWKQLYDRHNKTSYPSSIDQTIKKYLPSRNSGTLKFLIEKMFQSALPSDGTRAKKVQELVDQLVKKATIATENYYLLADRIGSDANAIGLLGYAYYHRNKENIKPIKINGIVPTQENIGSVSDMDIRRYWKQ